MHINIRKMTADDYPAVAAIYAEGIATGNATFQTAPPTWESWDHDHMTTGRLVAENTEGMVLAWASLVAVSGRCVYAGVAESSVYVAAAARGLGVGKALMLRLIEDAEAAGLWTLQAGIFVENTGSIELHEKVGFRRIGYRERIGQTADGTWRDTWLFERRSAVVGV